jgi:hypothetical protein
MEQGTTSRRRCHWGVDHEEGDRVMTERAKVRGLAKRAIGVGAEAAKKAAPVAKKAGERAAEAAKKAAPVAKKAGDSLAGSLERASKRAGERQKKL